MNLFKRSLIGSLGLLFALTTPLTGCVDDLPTGPDPTRSTLPFTARAYFSQANQNLEHEQIYSIDRATESIYVFMPRFSNGAITQALLRAKQRGVNVSIATPASGTGAAEYTKLRAAGIPAKGITQKRNGQDWDDTHRYMVVDQRYVWLNSSDLTAADQTNNDNNALMFDLPALAAQFIRHFNSEYGMATPTFEEIASGGSTASTQPAYALLRMAPNDEIEYTLSSEIGRAKTSVRFLSPTLTSNSITNTLSSLAAKGVTVMGVVEKDNASASEGQYTQINDKGGDIRVDGNPHSMSHSVVIIDGHTIIVGSYALQSESKSSQSLLKIRYDNSLNLEYTNEFSRIFSQSNTLVGPKPSISPMP